MPGLIAATPTGSSATEGDVISIVISWATLDASQVEVTMQEADGSESFLSSWPRGWLVVPCRQDHQSTFRLYDLANNARTILDVVSVGAAAAPVDLVASGFILVVANPCLPGCDDAGQIVVSWFTRGASRVELTLQIDEDQRLLSAERAGSKVARDIYRGDQCTLRLFDTSSELPNLLDAVVFVAG